MVCKYCNKEIEDNSAFCGYCGESTTVFKECILTSVTFCIIGIIEFISNKRKNSIIAILAGIFCLVFSIFSDINKRKIQRVKGEFYEEMSEL